MKKFLLKSILLLSAVLALSSGTYDMVIADEPAVITLSVEPELIVIPGTDTYYMDGYRSDVFFCDGFWYRPWHGGWYRSDSYSGRWVTVRAEMVPHDVYAPPHNWRQSIVSAPRMRYGEVRDNWQGWKSNNYWKSNGWKRQGPTGRNQNVSHNNNGQAVKTTATVNSVKLGNVKQNNQKNTQKPDSNSKTKPQGKSSQGQGKNSGGGNKSGGGDKNSGGDKEKKDK